MRAISARTRLITSSELALGSGQIPMNTARAAEPHLRLVILRPQHHVSDIAQPDEVVAGLPDDEVAAVWRRSRWAQGAGRGARGGGLRVGGAVGGARAVFMGVWPLPNANSLDAMKRVRAEMALIQKELPTGLRGRDCVPDATKYMEDLFTRC